MNIRKFAKQCGISPSAASRILSRNLEESQASQATYDRVRHKAAELGYMPNYAAKTLHTQRSNCIGVIIANPGPITTVSIMNGVTECARRHGAFLSIVTCKNDLEQEAEAFDNLLYRGVDAIVWLPTFQRQHYDCSHIERILRKYPRRHIVVCLGDYAPDGFFKFRANYADYACWAAKRQLTLGCKKFGIIWNIITRPFVLKSMKSYRTTLVENGVPEQDIVDFILNDPGNPPQWKQLSNIQGLWVYQALSLYSLVPVIHSACNLKQVHVDGQIMLDEYAFSAWNNIPVKTDERIENKFGSVQYYACDVEKCAYRGTEIAIQAMRDPSMEPFEEPFEWQILSSDYVPRNIYFHW